VGGGFEATEATGLLEDLTDGQIGEQPHSEDDPEHDAVSQVAGPLAGQARAVEGLFQGCWGKNRFQGGQLVQNATVRIDG
jgi:hypothetical protein